MRFHSKESGVRRGLRVWTFAIFGRLLVLLMMAGALLSACDNAPQPPPTSEPTSTSPPTSTLTPIPTETSTLTSTPTNTPTPTPGPTSSPTNTPTPTPGPTSSPTTTPTPTPARAVALALDSEATVTAYWSDGTANVEVTASLRNEGDLPLDGVVRIAVACSQNGEAIGGCSEEVSLGLADGYGPATDTVTLRVPMGDVSLTFAYGEGGATVLDIDVPERIVGVDRDMWNCFSDSIDFTALTPEERVGCAGRSSDSEMGPDFAGESMGLRAGKLHRGLPKRSR